MSKVASTFPIVLHGAYHTDNYGDMLLMHLYRQWLEACGPEVEVRMPFVPAATRTRFDPGPRRGLTGLAGAQLFVYGGGGYFGEPPRNAARWSLRLALRHLSPGLLAAMGGADVLVCGVGVGPLRHPLPRRMLTRLLTRASLIAVRDEPSRTALVELGFDPKLVIVTADAAMTLQRPDLPPASVSQARAFLHDVAGHPTLAVHMSQASAALGIADDVVRFARARPSLRVIAVTDQAHAASQLSAQAELTARLPDQTLTYVYPGPWELSALLAEVDMVITTKLHVGIVSVALGTAVRSYPAHTKTPRFYDQIDAPEACRPLRTLRPGDVYADLTAHFGRPEAVLHVPDAVRSAAAANRDLLQERVRSRIDAWRAEREALDG